MQNKTFTATSETAENVAILLNISRILDSRSKPEAIKKK